MAAGCGLWGGVPSDRLFFSILGKMILVEMLLDQIF